MPHRHATRLLIPTIVVLLAARAPACLWDYDTLRDEKRGMPGIAEVLAGKFERHSRFFYEKRVERMTALLARNPKDLDAWDNLAVAYEKLDRRDDAIRTILEKERVAPGEYTTYANLGTFYLHKGDFENGIAYLRKALAINPNAHFGREEYQVRLAEFLRDAAKDLGHPPRTDFLGIVPTRTGEPTTGPAAGDDERIDVETWTYAGRPERLGDIGLKPNVFDGLVGMLRFGPGTSAELYFTLGDLLVTRGDKNLAYRAYQRALELKHPRARVIRAVMDALRSSIYDGKDVTPEAIAAERNEADAWVKAYQQYEDDRLLAGQSLETEADYEPFYRSYGKPVRGEPPWPDTVFSRTTFNRYPVLTISAICVGVLSACFVLKRVVLLAFPSWRKESRRRLTP